jgi:DNA mismatch repair ATPase MutS
LLPVYAFDALFVQVGDFYEAIGFDACILVEHAGLNPFGGLRSDSIPKAGCPIVVCFYNNLFMLYA